LHEIDIEGLTAAGMLAALKGLNLVPSVKNIRLGYLPEEKMMHFLRLIVVLLKKKPSISNIIFYYTRCTSLENTEKEWVVKHSQAIFWILCQRKADVGFTPYLFYV